MLGHTLPVASTLTSARPFARPTAGISDQPASCGLTVTLGQPLKGHSQRAWHRIARDWGRPRPSARLTLPSRHHLGRKGATGHSGQENGQGPRSPRRPSKAPPRQNAWAHAPARQRPHLGPPLQAPHSQRIGPVGLLGANPNPRSAPEWPLLRGRGATSETLDPRAPAPDSLCHPSATRAARGAAGHSGQGNGQDPLSPQQPSKAPCAKMLGPTLPLASVLTLASPSDHRTAGGSGLPAP